MDFKVLEAQKDAALKLYNIAKENLTTAAQGNDPAAVVVAAQAANDAWCQFKKMDNEVTNGLVLKNLKDLYHA